jgi:hypothetical protein
MLSVYAECRGAVQSAFKTQIKLCRDLKSFIAPASRGFAVVISTTPSVSSRGLVTLPSPTFIDNQKTRAGAHKTF